MARALVTVGRGQIPLRVRNLKSYAVHLRRFQKQAMVAAVDPGSVKEEQELSMVKGSPGVVKVSFPLFN